jgi:hypothetical protein
VPRFLAAARFDYRLFHFGGANRSARRRPVAYAVYARPWFSDRHNFPRHRDASLVRDWEERRRRRPERR